MTQTRQRPFAPDSIEIEIDKALRVLLAHFEAKSHTLTARIIEPGFYALDGTVYTKRGGTIYAGRYNLRKDGAAFQLIRKEDGSLIEFIYDNS